MPDPGKLDLIGLLPAQQPGALLNERVSKPVQFERVPPGIGLVGDVQINLDTCFEPTRMPFFVGQAVAKLLHRGTQLSQFDRGLVKARLNLIRIAGNRYARYIFPQYFL